MKKLVLLLVIFPIITFAQEKSTEQYQISMELKVADYKGGIDVYQPTDYGLIKGSFEIGRNKAVWHADNEIDERFFVQYSEAYYNIQKSPELFNNGDMILETNKLSRDYQTAGFLDRKVTFGFYHLPELDKADSIGFYCKYTVLSKLKDSLSYNFVYNNSYHEKYFRIPINLDAHLKFLEDIYPNLVVIVNVTKIDWKALKDKAIKEGKVIHDLSYYDQSLNAIRESIKQSKLNLNDLKISFEYVRTDKKDQKILSKKLFYPLVVSNSYSTTKQYFESEIPLYKGHMELPFEIYNEEVKSLIKYVEDWKFKNFEYDVIAIPISKENDEYIFHVYFPQYRYYAGTGKCYFKEIKLKDGEKIKIKLEKDNWALLGRKDGKEVVIHEEDLSNFVNEYYFLALENLEEVKSDKNKNDQSLPNSIDNKISKERDALITELRRLANEEVERINRTHRYLNEKDRRVYTENATYDFLIKKGDTILDILGTGRYVGNDNVNKIRASISIVRNPKYNDDSRDIEKYRVKSGDSIEKIASRYGVSVSKLKNWNNIYSNSVKKGQVLIVYKNENKKYVLSPVKIIN